MPEFQNLQWTLEDEFLETDIGAVTPAMIGETPEYPIDRTQLFEKTERSGVTYYDWPVHMAEKTWVDIEQFIEAFEAAIRSQAKLSGRALDEDMLARSFQYARADNARMRSRA